MTRRRWSILVLAGAGVVLAVGSIVALLAGDDGDRGGLIASDGSGDCREPRRDFGERCDPGADVISVQVDRDGESLVIAVELDQRPMPSDQLHWMIELHIAADAGRVCGITNVVDDSAPTEHVVVYGFDPAYGLSPLTRRALPDGVCQGVLDGSTARFTVDVSGQDEAVDFRVVGFTRIEHLGEGGPGSEDDFGVDVSLAGL